MTGTLAELYTARSNSNELAKTREDYVWDRRSPLVGQKVYTSKGVGNIAAVSECNSRILVRVQKYNKEMMFKPEKVRDKMMISTKRKKTTIDSISLAVTNLSDGMLRMVCTDNGIDYENIARLNPGLRKVCIANILKSRLKRYGSVFIVDQFHRTITEIDLKSKLPIPVDPNRLYSRE